VAIGLVAEARIAEAVGVAPGGLAMQVSAGLERLSLPVRIPVGLAADRLLDAMRLDKKRSGNELRFSLLRDLGIAARDGDHWTVAAPDRAAILQALRDSGAA
ncbi:MAG TPA: hypothetical protein VFV65_06115, partial [Gemmatimonadales bacterium]|nr:hypothetical protein [Gemmatimonadales bacterium]